VTGFNTERIAYMLTGDSSFTGRTVIWGFAEGEIARSPLVGWGYQVFWLAGADAPSVVDAPGWVKGMPNAHNGYYDTILELGYVGLVLLLTFIVTTLHVIGQMASRDLKRSWILLALAIYVIAHNFLETTWMRSYEIMWVVFVITAVEAARFRQAASVRRAAPQAPPRATPFRAAGLGHKRRWQTRPSLRFGRPPTVG
jgi:exopolysaccharide production protein ExoQ